jgi:hypothetical protein
VTIRNYITQNLAQLDRNGISFDETINVLTGGNAGETVSLRAAIGAGWTAQGRTGPRKPGWCWFCRFLSITVQPHHCELQFVDTPSNWKTWVRAGVAFALGIGGVAGIVHAALQYLF